MPFLLLDLLNKSHCKKRERVLGPETGWGGKEDKKFKKGLSLWIVDILLGMLFYILALKTRVIIRNIFVSASIWWQNSGNCIRISTNVDKTKMLHKVFFFLQLHYRYRPFTPNNEIQILQMRIVSVINVLLQLWK